MPEGSAGQPALLGIDLGTSSVKVVVLELDGRMLGFDNRRRTRWTSQAPAGPRPTLRLWWDAVVGATRAAVAACNGATPVAIGFSGQMHGLVPTGSDGRAVRPAMLWSDSRAVGELDAYRSLPASLRDRLGNPLTPGMAGPMLAWLRTHERHTYDATRWALQPKDWLRAQLTGQFHAEPSDASATLLYDVVADDWDRDLVAALGLDPESWHHCSVAAGHRAGVLLPGPAAELGLDPGIPVAAGAGDTAAAALGSGLARGDSQLTIGTGAQVVTPSDAPDRGVGPWHRAGHPSVSRGDRHGLVRDGGRAQRWLDSRLGSTAARCVVGGAVCHGSRRAVERRSVLPAAPGRRTHSLSRPESARRMDRPFPSSRPNPAPACGSRRRCARCPRCDDTASQPWVAARRAAVRRRWHDRSGVASAARRRARLAFGPSTRRVPPVAAQPSWGRALRTCSARRSCSRASRL